MAGMGPCPAGIKVGDALASQNSLFPTVALGLLQYPEAFLPFPLEDTVIKNLKLRGVLVIRRLAIIVMVMALSLGLVRTMLNTGLRSAEAINLRHRDVDWHSGRFTVRGGKGDKDRTLRLSSGDLILLNHWLAYKGVKLQCGANFFPGAYLFTDLSGTKKVCARWLHKLIVRLAEQAGIAKRLHPHSLRHTFGTDLYRMTGKLALVQDALGHEDILTTRIYVKIANEELEEAMANLRNGG